ncbi:Transient receptor potential (TRP) ion channel [Geosmithia morbida]|uniref:Transient receptor potential (TRP) ion channel n=1 Tax=Geosmithia morbida TaxID=1094350 RepID=A0A9P5D195_9HYPO|nr:Transient receptor potential (TRP) ion channel [Geosmithia morbida]KAF4122507.1 Transient receptor potential (TRP) ion channel [Geosmithia morbida]
MRLRSSYLPASLAPPACDDDNIASPTARVSLSNPIELPTHVDDDDDDDDDGSSSSNSDMTITMLEGSAADAFIGCQHSSGTSGSRGPRRRQRQRRPPNGIAIPTTTSTSTTTVPLLLLALLLALLTPTVAAVQIPFTNCLSAEYRFNKPRPLQWEPLYADAVFDTETDSHNLRLTIWGNVSGSVSDTTLPAANSPYWQDDNETEGKIVRSPDPDAADAKATTLYRKVDILTYQPWSQAVDFCTEALVNYTCPLSPVFSPDVQEPYGLPSFNLSHDFYSSYAFSTFNPTLIVIWGDRAATDIGCISASITPDLGRLAQLVRFLPLLVLALTGVAVVFAAVYSPWGSTNVFHWTSNYGRDADLLRLVTPGFGDCLQYIQFVVLTGGLGLSYPGFYQPIVSRASWAALMFAQSFVKHADPWEPVVDGVYVTEARNGMARLAQLAGMAEPADVWAGMMVWLCVIVLAATVLAQAGFLVQWLLRFLSSTPEEDLRAKNLPFSVGNVIRIVYNYFLLPIISLSTFQLVVADESPSFAVALAVVTIVALLVFTAWSLRLIITTRPKSVLFDDLPIVLRYGPLYNTYEDHSAAFALIPVVLTFVRGIAIGAVQASGIAQVVLLAICEIIQTLTIHAFRPFGRPTSMNAYHTVFSALRFVSLMLMVTFAPSLGVTDGPKGWIGYAILVLHAVVLTLGFFVNALQTIVEVVALMLGAGGDDDRGLTRGGLSKIFGMRQLSRRATPRDGPSRASQLSTAAMLDVDDGAKTGYSMPGGRLRSSSGASLGAILLGPAAHRRTGSGLDSPDMYVSHPGQRPVDSASSYAPGTPGGTSTFSFLTSAAVSRTQNPPPVPEASDPYYRPPRRRRDTLPGSQQPDDCGHGDPASAAAAAGAAAGAAGAAAGATTAGAASAGATDSKRLSAPGDAADLPGDISRGATPAPAANPDILPPNRPDYSTREVDFYYGVRGPALNSDGPGRKLGTGPADPTGPVATASVWFRSIFGGKTKEKGKGFEVVRSARMPPDMARNGGFGDETPPEGIPVAMGVLRNGPIESDDDDDRGGDDRAVAQQQRSRSHSKAQSQSQSRSRSRPGSNSNNNPAAASRQRKPDGLLTDDGRPRPGDDDSDDPVSPVSHHHHHHHRHDDDDPLRDPVSPISISDSDDPDEQMPASPASGPEIPRKSSKRHSALMDHPSVPAPVPVPAAAAEAAPPARPLTAGQNQTRLPFEHHGSQRSANAGSSRCGDDDDDDDDEDFRPLSRLPSSRSDRPVSFGVVSQRNPARVDPAFSDVDILSSSAEVIDRGR